MSKADKCSSCGYMIPNTVEKCPYCGSANPNFSVKEKIVDNFQQKAFSKDEEPVFHDTPVEKPKMNWLLFVLLLICCWPVAIVYLVINYGKKKEH